MNKIIQFTHPGGEHKPARNGNTIPWNTGKHKRKFLLAQGDYVDNGTLHKGKELVFWGEWEPNSDIVQRLDNSQERYPKYLNKPVLNRNATGERQNTDPFVFSDQFLYCCCKQTKTGRPTQMALLEKGDIILFGSTINQNKDDAYFALDTVFVIGDYIDYTPTNYKKQLTGKVPDDYFLITLDRFMGGSSCGGDKNIACGSGSSNICNSGKGTIGNNLTRRCYFGANYDNPIDGMYSFAPAQLYNNNNVGFKRLELTNKLIPELQNNLNASPKSLKSSLTNKQVWDILVKEAKDKKLVLGMNFKYE